MFGFLAQFLAWCYNVVPNYGVAIALFTLIIMVVITPLTIKGMRSMAEMARLQPEMKKLQDQYKNDRLKLNEEMQALFKEHNVNPLGGCLPTLLPLPVFIVIFRLLERLTSKNHYQLFDPRRVLNNLPNPHYLSHNSSLYQHLVRDGGKMVSFGFDLGKTARDHHASVAAALPYYGLIVIMTVSQYVQQQQMNKRNPQAANANPQMKITMQLFPAFYAVISLAIPASVVLYLLISGLFRMAQNYLSYTYDPKLKSLAVSAGAGDTVIETSSRPSAGQKAALRSGGPAGGDRDGGRGSAGGGNGAGPKGAAPSQSGAAPSRPAGPRKGAVNVRPGKGRGSGSRRRGR
jgi:YidC/Oxa1 family membrane protein insertase